MSNGEFDDVERLEADGRWSEAAAAWQRHLQQADEPLQLLHIRINLVRCLWHDGEIDHARDALAAAAPAALSDIPAVLRGRMLLEEGRLLEISGRFRDARQKYADARDAAAEGSAVEAQLLMIRLARETGEITAASEAAEALRDAALDLSQHAALLSERGAIEMYRGSFDAAIILLNESLSANHGASAYQQAYTRLLLAECFISISRGSDAEDELRAVRNVFENVLDHRGRSEMYELWGRLYEARQDFHRAARSYHNGLQSDFLTEDVVGQARAYRHLARCYRELSEFSNAESALSDAERLVPAEHHHERASLYIEQGHLSCDQNDYDDAERQFRSAVALVADDRQVDPVPFARAQRGLARALRENSELAHAQRLLESTRADWPEDADRRELDDLLDDLAEVYLDADAFDRARDTLRDSLDIGAEVGTLQSRGRTQLLLSRALFALGDRVDAHSQLNDAIASLDYDGADARNTSWYSDALMQRGMFALADNEIRTAVDSFSHALKIANRRGDNVRIARAQRELAACYRLRGDFKRAGDFLEFAEDELRDVDDRMEREMLTLERARLDIAQWQHGDVPHRLNNARSFFASRGSAVRAARCDRLLGRAAFQNHDRKRSLELLGNARDTFERCKVSHELDDTYDDIAEVHLYWNELDDAETALDDSYKIDEMIQWHSGSGRTQLLRARIALQRGDAQRARQLAEDALQLFDDPNARDEINSSGAHVVLGDCALAEEKVNLALEEFRKARSLSRANGDQLGMACAFHRLGSAYMVQSEWARAEESFDQSDDCLENVRVIRQMAPLARDRGRLAIDWNNNHASAITYFERALRMYQSMSDGPGISDMYQRLVAAHQARNDHEEAFKYMQAMGVRHASLWTMLTKELNPLIGDGAASRFAHGSYRNAVLDAFGVVEAELRKGAAAAGVGTTNEGAPDQHIGIRLVLKSWLGGNAADPGAVTKLRVHDRSWVTAFHHLCDAGFDLVRNPLTHQLDSREMTPQEAFTGLCVANLILAELGGVR